ncbi:MAG: hypothetical protein RR034_00885 [Bacteroidales bacterium]
MDRIDIIITIGIALVYLFSVIKKKNAKNAENQTNSSSEEIDSENFPFEEPIKEIKKSTILEENSSNYSKNKEYFTYEDGNSMENIVNNEEYNQANLLSNGEIQSLENENETSINFEFTQEEIIKGIVYSEILKRPYS